MIAFIHTIIIDSWIIHSGDIIKYAVDMMQVQLLANHRNNKSM